MTRVRFPSLLFAVLLWCSAACTQGEGEVCQVKSDCGDNLSCCIGQSTTRGTCEWDCPNEEEEDEEEEPTMGDASTDAMMSQPEGGAQ